MEDPFEGFCTAGEEKEYQEDKVLETSDVKKMDEEIAEIKLESMELKESRLVEELEEPHEDGEDLVRKSENIWKGKLVEISRNIRHQTECSFFSFKDEDQLECPFADFRFVESIFFDDQKILVTSCDWEIHSWNLENQEKISTISSERHFQNIIKCDENSFLIYFVPSKTENCQICQYSVNPLKKVMCGEGGRAEDFSQLLSHSDGSFFAVQVQDLLGVHTERIYLLNFLEIGVSTLKYKEHIYESETMSVSGMILSKQHRNCLLVFNEGWSRISFSINLINYNNRKVHELELYSPKPESKNYERFSVVDSFIDRHDIECVVVQKDSFVYIATTSDIISNNGSNCRKVDLKTNVSSCIVVSDSFLIVGTGLGAIKLLRFQENMEELEEFFELKLDTDHKKVHQIVCPKYDVDDRSVDLFTCCSCDRVCLLKITNLPEFRENQMSDYLGRNDLQERAQFLLEEKWENDGKLENLFYILKIENLDSFCVLKSLVVI